MSTPDSFEIAQRSGTPTEGPDAATCEPADMRMGTTTRAAAMGEEEGERLGVTPALRVVVGVGVIDGVGVAVGCAVSEVDVEPVAVLEDDPDSDRAAVTDVVGRAEVVVEAALVASPEKDAPGVTEPSSERDELGAAVALRHSDAVPLDVGALDMVGIEAVGSGEMEPSADTDADGLADSDGKDAEGAGDCESLPDDAALDDGNSEALGTGETEWVPVDCPLSL